MFDPEEAFSDMTHEWVAEHWKKLPCEMTASGNVRTGPVRLSFPHLIKPQATENDDGTPGEPKYQVALLFPDNDVADLSLLKKVASEAAFERWPNAGKPGGPSLHTPFRDQREKIQYEGYVDGNIFTTVSSLRKPPLVDHRGIPITDESKVYPGVWALVSLRPFVFDVKKKKGVSFGLQAVMLIADDRPFGGSGGTDAATEFAGVSITKDVDPASLF